LLSQEKRERERGIVSSSVEASSSSSLFFVVLQLEQASQLFFAVQSIVIICRHKRKEREELFLPVLELHHPHFFCSVAIGTSLAAFLLFSRLL